MSQAVGRLYKLWCQSVDVLSWVTLGVRVEVVLHCVVLVDGATVFLL